MGNCLSCTESAVSEFNKKTIVANNGELNITNNVATVTSPEQVKEFLKQVRPLDLIVFRGADGVSSLIRNLELFTNGTNEASHVEVAITREWCPRIRPALGAFDGIAEDDKRLFSWGSTASGPLNDGVKNVETNRSKFGVQVRDMEALITHYLEKPNANVGLCRLVDNPTERRSTEDLDQFQLRKSMLIQSLCNAYDKYNGAMYNVNPFALLGALFPKLRAMRTESVEVLSNVCSADKWLFCSEFVAALYIEVGVINDATDGKKDGQVLNAANVVPVDFLGADVDKDGIMVPICEYPPKWIK